MNLHENLERLGVHPENLDDWLEQFNNPEALTAYLTHELVYDEGELRMADQEFCGERFIGVNDRTKTGPNTHDSESSFSVVNLCSRN